MPRKKTKAPVKTLIRKRERNKDLTKSTSVTKKVQVMILYTNGKSYEEIAKETGWTSASVKLEIMKIFNALKVLLSTENLINQSNLDDKSRSLAKSTTKQISLMAGQNKIDKDINSDFLSKLSGEKDSVLTQEEIMFCYLLVHEGDALKALNDSGLGKGLIKKSSSYKRASKLRILMLKGKRNLIRYISNLQVNYAREMNVNKEAVQSMLLRQIAQLEEQNDPKNAATIARLTQDLGRTVGAFSDRVVVEEVSFDDAMDKMLEMRKVKGTEETAKVTPETYVYNPEDIG